MIWCTLLNPALDVICKVNELHGGKTYLDSECLQTPAGKGLNVARAIRALGEEVGVHGLLPEYDGRRITAVLDGSGIQHHFLSIPGGMRINTTILEESNGNSTHISAASTPFPSRMQYDYTAFAFQHMQQGDYWCFSGSLPKGFADDTYAALIERGADAGITTMLDSRGPAFKRGVRARPLMIKPNMSELEEFFGEPVQGVHHIALKGKRFLDMGVAYVFISLGADGMIALHKNDCLLCSAPGVPVRDTVGCGDAMVAGVLVAFRRRFSFSETCRMAVACGSAKAMQNGPGVIDGTTVWQLMEEISVTAV
ncbi:MAG: hexose kinase [Chitinispirillaceae bacterium]|nr:hexose kinase [Chitinispirillaceae bacterium]